MLTALTIAAVVCIASSNGGTTSQDLKTGFLSAPRRAVSSGPSSIGALTSALVIGGTMLLLDTPARTTPTRDLPNVDAADPERCPEGAGRPALAREGHQLSIASSMSARKRR